MSLRVGPYLFTQITYYADDDVLYAHVDHRRGGEHVGHPDDPMHPFFAVDGEVIQLDLISPRAELDRRGRVTVTLPDGTSADVQGIEEALKQPA